MSLFLYCTAMALPSIPADDNEEANYYNQNTSRSMSSSDSESSREILEGLEVNWVLVYFDNIRVSIQVWFISGIIHIFHPVLYQIWFISYLHISSGALFFLLNIWKVYTGPQMDALLWRWIDNFKIGLCGWEIWIRALTFWTRLKYKSNKAN